MAVVKISGPLAPGDIYHGDARVLLQKVEPESIALSLWSPPYYVGKDYEKHLSYDEWRGLLSRVIALLFPLIRPGGFLAVNIADILCFKDEAMPKIMAENVSGRRMSVTKKQILGVQRRNPSWNRYRLAEHFGCSEQTIDRRVNGNNARGGKYQAQTRVKLAGGFLEEAAMNAGLYLYDRRVWVKDAAWENSKWHTISYRSVDEFEYVYIFWKPGITTVDRSRLSKQEWINWGSRAVWKIASVRSNADHDSKFPVELPRRVVKLLTKPGDVVLDCFMGSGTTAIAALSEGRRYIGIEKEKRSVEIARKAVAAYTRTAKGAAKEAGQLDLMIRELESSYQN
ncbi:MAG: site-specific DNA-methyltransferase [Alphaproteobacteria bacterium]|nr:site-specific DNA-methyltransferase [Alphaproteobacteria bacterium]